MEFARSVFAVLGDLAARLLAPFVDGATIVYWPYLLAAAALTLGLAMVASLGTSGGAKTFLHDAFSKKVWWSPSSRADYFYYLINIIVFPILFAPAILAQSAVGGEVSAVLTTIFGAWPEPLFSEAALRIAYTVLFFVAYDFGRYAAHWSLHTYPVLWEFHKTHHSAETLTPITSFRQHPVELIVMGLGGNLMGGLATGGFLYLGAGSISAYTVLGTHAGIAVYNMIGNLRHSHVWLDYGWLGHIFVSPAQHQIHHSALPQHRDRNLGFALAIWDWMFGTIHVPKSRELFPMGLGDGSDGAWHSPWQLYWRPLVGAAQVLRHGRPFRALVRSERE